MNDEPGQDAQASISRIRKAESLGQYLTAADYARRALEDLADQARNSEREIIEYHLVRSVARAGATDRAFDLYKKYKLGEVRKADYQSLGARLEKDQALANFTAERTELLRKAARSYEAVHKNFKENRSYNAVNAATLFLLAGDGRASEMAKTALAECERENPGEPGAADRNAPNAYEPLYWHHVTVAEAELVLGNISVVEDMLHKAGELPYGDFANRASTRKQLRLICEHSGIDLKILDGIANPEVIFFAGHIIAREGETGRFPAEQESQVRAGIEKYLDTHRIAAAFGSLAAGADMLVAEACIARDKYLGIVLPFQEDDFVEISVRCSGDGWVKRYETCMDWIRTPAETDRGAVTYATDGAYLGDDSLFVYCAHIAMGLAMVRARHLDTGVRMLTVYDGSSGSGVGTDGNIEMWQEFGLPVDIIPVTGNAQGDTASPAQPMHPGDFPKRIPRAILFGDVAGFSSLREEELPHFHSQFMARLSDVINRFGDKVLYRNSWGDAIYVVLDDALAAAQCGLALQRAASEFDHSSHGIGSKLELRLGGHYGPVFDGHDFIRNEPTFFGSHVTRTARIEPIAMPGEVYVTEEMAAALALSGDQTIECGYVGIESLAKGYGKMRMYVLKSRA